MKYYGLIGQEIGHSFSPAYFAQKFDKEGIFDAHYHCYPLASIQDFSKLLKQQPLLSGLNVTIPYKTAIIPYLDCISPQAKAVGAVNTIAFDKGQLIGHNTDVFGFESSLTNTLLPHHKGCKALILGTGGASKAVQYVCQRLNIGYQLVSRTKGKNLIQYASIDANILSQHLLIINTSPLGMHPNTSSYPLLPYTALSTKHLLYDLVYNPSITTFMQKGIDIGATVTNGLKMLELQADKSWEIWQNNVT